MVQSRLQHGPHELLCSTRVDEEERLTQQGVLLSDRESFQQNFRDPDGLEAASDSYLLTHCVQRTVLKAEPEVWMDGFPDLL